jgi:4-amino-4-deoxy-L-arabinose transferase-like glycosyltransferase
MMTRFRRFRKFRRREFLTLALLILLAAAFRIAVAHHWPNDAPDDSKIYARIARNVLEQHSYSEAEGPPYEPTLIRLPGYPLFLAGIYKVFGYGNNGAVRIAQALIDTGTCALISLLAFYWEPDEERKRAAAIAALAVAAMCPFTTIYSATVLTEVPTMFLAVAMCVAATKALTTEDTEKDAKRFRKRLLWWSVAGLLGGVAVLIRPDSGLFVAAIGLTLLVAGVIRFRKHVRKMFASGAIFSLAFVLMLTPWTIRNWRVFHRFQPLAPAHGEMPNEFVAHGYFRWLRTWLDDERYIAPFLWSLDTDPINMDDVPPQAFDSAEEKDRVATLLEKYNHPNGPQPVNSATPQPSPTPQASPIQTPASSRPPNAKPTPATAQKDSNANANNNAEDTGDESDQGDETDNPNEPAQPEPHGPVQMTPEIDAAFAQLARERIARHPFRVYVWLPIARAETMWFDTHSQYWPFEGDLLPFEDLDYASHQQFWLPLFAGLTGVYTLLGLLGGWLLWQSGKSSARTWLLLAGLMIFMRLAFFSTLENPEPRYVVEFFPFLSILSGVAIAKIKKPPTDTDNHR